MEIESYRRGYLAAHAEREARSQRARKDVERLLPEAARLLRERYGAGRVGVFGSYANGTFREDSDVDLYVDAVKLDYFSCLADLSDLFGRPVDVVEMSSAPESLRARIREDGHDLP